jgi:hypothetical protein
MGSDNQFLAIRATTRDRFLISALDLTSPLNLRKASNVAGRLVDPPTINAFPNLFLGSCLLFSTFFGRVLKNGC